MLDKIVNGHYRYKFAVFIFRTENCRKPKNIKEITYIGNRNTHLTNLHFTLRILQYITVCVFYYWYISSILWRLSLYHKIKYYITLTGQCVCNTRGNILIRKVNLRPEKKGWLFHFIFIFHNIYEEGVLFSIIKKYGIAWVFEVGGRIYSFFFWCKGFLIFLFSFYLIHVRYRVSAKFIHKMVVYNFICLSSFPSSANNPDYSNEIND